MSALKIEWIGEEAGFDALAPEWDSLLPEHSTPFDLHCWHAAWWRAFGAEATMAVPVVRRDGKLVAAVPMAREGRALVSWTNDHSPLFRPLAADPEAMEALLAAVFGRGTGAVEFRAMPDPSGDPVVAASRGASRLTLPLQGYVSPIVDTDGELEAWLKGDHAKWKSRIGRYKRKIERDFDDADLAMVVSLDDPTEWLEEGIRIEGSGWKAREGTAIDSQPETASFYREIAAAFQARGELRLNRIGFDGEGIAFSLCILHGNRLYSLKAGFDEARRKLSPGLVLQLAIIERCFELGIERYELLGETSDWKDKVATSELTHTDLRSYPRRPGGAALYSWRRWLRPRLKETRDLLRSFDRSRIRVPAAIKPRRGSN